MAVMGARKTQTWTYTSYAYYLGVACVLFRHLYRCAYKASIELYCGNTGTYFPNHGKIGRFELISYTFVAQTLQIPSQRENPKTINVVQFLRHEHWCFTFPLFFFWGSHEDLNLMHCPARTMHDPRSLEDP